MDLATDCLGMAVSNVNSSAQIQDLARQLARAVDANRDGQVSLNEFGDFLKKLLQTSTSLSATVKGAGTGSTTALAETALGFEPIFQGFDASRRESARGSLKYDAYNVLMNYDPHDPTAMKRAFVVLDAMHPGMYELDPYDNLMLTGTATATSAPDPSIAILTGRIATRTGHGPGSLTTRPTQGRTAKSEVRGEVRSLKFEV